VAVPEVSARKEVVAKRKAYEEAVKLQRVGD
jgi:3D-(3,5/4)-trihydroxycyclohexane-1,2-dione acylhydrolase (decyclizing)